jgi:hypothetical protein
VIQSQKTQTIDSLGPPCPKIGFPTTAPGQIQPIKEISDSTSSYSKGIVYQTNIDETTNGGSEVGPSDNFEKTQDTYFTVPHKDSDPTQEITATETSNSVNTVPMIPTHGFITKLSEYYPPTYNLIRNKKSLGQEYGFEKCELGDPALGGLLKTEASVFHVFNDLARDAIITHSISYKIQSELKWLAEEGKLMVDYNVFLRRMIESLSLDDLQVQTILLKAADLNIITITNRQLTQKHQ